MFKKFAKLISRRPHNVNFVDIWKGLDLDTPAYKRQGLVVVFQKGEKA